MAETLTLTVPIQPPAATTLIVTKLFLDAEIGIINARLKTNIGTYETYLEQDPDTKAAVLALNTANLTIKSLQRRLIERMQTKNPAKWGGAISGTPD